MKINGVINVNKDKGMTSFDVIFRLRKMLDTRKMGHTGTLDPDAVGVLPVCVGRATKAVDMMTGMTKTYRAVMRLGIMTDTQDLSGNVLEERPVQVSEEDLKSIILSFQGEQMQLPPMYSAVKVNGQKLVDLARRGVEVERKLRPVTFSEITIEAISMPEVTFSVTCSKGAYIRTLCHDIGEMAGCGAAMASLQRTRVGSFTIDRAWTLDAIGQEITKCEDPSDWPFLIPTDELFADEPRIVSRSVKQDRFLLNGRPLKAESELADGTRCRVYLTSGDFVGLYRHNKAENRFDLEKFFYDLSE